VQIVI